MRVSDIHLGLKVAVPSNGMEALVVGEPEYYTAAAKLVRIKYNNSTRFEYVTNHMIEALPWVHQAPAYQELHG